MTYGCEFRLMRLVPTFHFISWQTDKVQQHLYSYTEREAMERRLSIIESITVWEPLVATNGRCFGASALSKYNSPDINFSFGCKANQTTVSAPSSLILSFPESLHQIKFNMSAIDNTPNQQIFVLYSLINQCMVSSSHRKLGMEVKVGINTYDLEKLGILLATPGVSAQPGCIE